MSVALGDLFPPMKDPCPDALRADIKPHQIRQPHRFDKKQSQKRHMTRNGRQRIRSFGQLGWRRRYWNLRVCQIPSTLSPVPEVSHGRCRKTTAQTGHPAEQPETTDSDGFKKASGADRTTGTGRRDVAYGCCVNDLGGNSLAHVVTPISRYQAEEIMGRAWLHNRSDFRIKNHYQVWHAVACGSGLLD